MTTALAERDRNPTPDTIEQVLINGDLGKLTADQRIAYYKRVCETLGLNPYTKPFDYLQLSGKLVLYAKRDATEQLRKLHNVSVEIVAREIQEDCYVVTARATDGTGRRDESLGAVPIATLKGEARANALMKAETKAKRRVTLSICGLGMLDETEVETLDPRVASEPKPVPPAPDGFDDWLMDLEATADEGEVALRDTWTKAPPVMRRHLIATDAQRWDAIKHHAKQATA